MIFLGKFFLFFLMGVGLMTSPQAFGAEVSSSDTASYAIYQTAIYLCHSIEDECLEQSKATIEGCSLLRHEFDHNDIKEPTLWLGLKTLTETTDEDPIDLGKKIAWLCVAEKAYLNLLGLNGGSTLSFEAIQKKAVEQMSGTMGTQKVKTVPFQCGESEEMTESGSDFTSSYDLFSGCGLGTSLEGYTVGQGGDPIDPSPMDSRASGFSSGGSLSGAQVLPQIPDFFKGPCAGLNPKVVMGDGASDESPNNNSPNNNANATGTGNATNQNSADQNQTGQTNNGPSSLPEIASPSSNTAPDQGSSTLQTTVGGVPLKVEVSGQGAMVSIGSVGSVGSGSFNNGSIEVSGVTGVTGDLGSGVQGVFGVYHGASFSLSSGGKSGVSGGIGFGGSFRPNPMANDEDVSGLVQYCRSEVFNWFAAACIGTISGNSPSFMPSCSTEPVMAKGQSGVMLFQEQPICRCGEYGGAIDTEDPAGEGEGKPSVDTVIIKNYPLLDKAPCCPEFCVVAVGEACSECRICKDHPDKGKNGCKGLAEPLFSKFCGTVDPAPHQQLFLIGQ